MQHDAPITVQRESPPVLHGDPQPAVSPHGNAPATIRQESTSLLGRFQPCAERSSEVCDHDAHRRSLGHFCLSLALGSHFEPPLVAF